MSFPVSATGGSPGLMPAAKEGKVEAAVLCFQKVLDLGNFRQVVLERVAPDVMVSIFNRLGWLNVVNPYNPDGFYVLDLAEWDQRRVAQMLVDLAVKEPG